MFHQELLAIIEALKSNDNNKIQNAYQLRNEILSNHPDAFILTHFGLLSSATDETSSITILILLTNLFHTMTIQQIPISEETSLRTQTAIIELFKNINASENQLENISNLACKVENYFQGNWVGLPKSILSGDLLGSSNNLISAISANCLSELINRSIINSEPFIQPIFGYLVTSFNNVNSSIIPKIASLLRLFYSIFPFIKNHSDENFISIIRTIPSFLPLCQSDHSIARDLSLFANVNAQIIFLETYQLYYNSLIEIINNSECDLGVRNVCCYILEVLLNHFTVQFKSNSIFLFKFFANLYPQLEDTSLHLLSEISSLYGGEVNYGLEVFTFFESNFENPFSFAIFGSCFPGVSDHFCCDDFVQKILSAYSNAFQSDNDQFRYFAFSHFLPILQFLYVRKFDYNQNAFLDLFLNILRNESNEAHIVEEITVLSTFISFYGGQFGDFLKPIFEVLDFFLHLFQSSFHIYEVISCYKYLASYFRDAIMEFSQNINLLFCRYFDNFQEYRDAFFYCLENIPFFALSFPNFNDICGKLFAVIFTQIYNSNFEPSISLTESEMNSIIVFLSNYMNNDLTIPIDFVSPILGLAFKYSNSPIEFEHIDSPEDCMFSDGIQFLAPNNGHVMVSQKQINKFRESLSIINAIFCYFPDLIPSNYQNLFELIQNQLNKCIVSSIYPDIQQLEILILPLIPDLEILVKLLIQNQMSAMKGLDTLDLEIVASLLNFVREMIKVVGQKWGDNQQFPQIVIPMLLFLVKAIHKQYQEIAAEKQSISDQTFDSFAFDNAKMHVALVLREAFRYFPIVSTGMIPFMMDMINGLIREDPRNIIFCVVIFSDLLKLGSVNQDLSAYLISLCGELLQNQDSHLLRACGIYGLSICMTPQYMNAEEMNQHFQQIMPLFTFDAKGSLYKHMINFTLLQIILNYQDQIDVSEYFTYLWKIFTPTMIVHDYEVEFLAQSIYLLVTTFPDAIPPEMKPKISQLIKNLLRNELNEELQANLHSLYEKIRNE